MQSALVIILATHHLHTLPRWVIANRCCRPFARRERLSQASLTDWLQSRCWRGCWRDRCCWRGCCNLSARRSDDGRGRGGSRSESGRGGLQQNGLQGGRSTTSAVWVGVGRHRSTRTVPRGILYLPRSVSRSVSTMYLVWRLIHSRYIVLIHRYTVLYK